MITYLIPLFLWLEFIFFSFQNIWVKLLSCWLFWYCFKSALLYDSHNMVLFILLWIFNTNLNRINHPHTCPVSLNNCIYFKRRETNSKACLQSNHFTAFLTHFILILMKTQGNFYHVWEITNAICYHFYVLYKLAESKSWP